MNRDWNHVIFETDSEIVYKECATAGDGNRWKLRSVVKDIKELLHQIPIKKLQAINRNANEAADWVASQAIKGMCDNGWLRLPPSSLVHILNKDGLPVPPLVPVSSL